MGVPGFLDVNQTKASVTQQQSGRRGLQIAPSSNGLRNTGTVCLCVVYYTIGWMPLGLMGLYWTIGKVKYRVLRPRTPMHRRNFGTVLLLKVESVI